MKNWKCIVVHVFKSFPVRCKQFNIYKNVKIQIFCIRILLLEIWQWVTFGYSWSLFLSNVLSNKTWFLSEFFTEINIHCDHHKYKIWLTFYLILRNCGMITLSQVTTIHLRLKDNDLNNYHSPYGLLQWVNPKQYNKALKGPDMTLIHQLNVPKNANFV